MMINLNNACFETTAVNIRGYPDNDIPRVAFVGRSNVGKSSAINMLLKRKNLARTGSTPGKTRVINFFNIDRKLYFVDLPGYGYASAPKSELDSWKRMIDEFLVKSANLKLMVMLLDIRHEPGALDIMMHEWILSSKIPYLIIATKADKLKKREITDNISVIRKTLKISGNVPLLVFSTKDKTGFTETWDQIEKVCLS